MGVKCYQYHENEKVANCSCFCHNQTAFYYGFQVFVLPKWIWNIKTINHPQLFRCQGDLCVDATVYYNLMLRYLWSSQRLCLKLWLDNRSPASW